MRKGMETFIKLRDRKEKVTVNKQCGRKTDETGPAVPRETFS